MRALPNTLNNPVQVPTWHSLWRKTHVRIDMYTNNLLFLTYYSLHLTYFWLNCTFILVFLEQTLWQLYPPLKMKGLFVWGNSWMTESLYHIKSREWIVQPIRRQECKYHACKCIKSASRVQKYLNQLSSVHNTGLSSDREGVKVEVRGIRG